MLDERRAAHAPQAPSDEPYDEDVPLELPAIVEDEEEAAAVRR
jgi:hypothetical protein